MTHFCFYTSLWSLKKGLWRLKGPHKNFFDAPERTVKIKKLCYYSPLFGIGTTRVKTLFLLKSRTYAISVSLTIERHKNRTWGINWGSQKFLQGLVSHELTAYLSIFNLFKLNKLWPYYQKNVNQILLNWHLSIA